MICLGGFGQFDLRTALVAGLGLVLPVVLAAAAGAEERANERPVLLAQNGKTEKLDALKQRDEELKSARDEQHKSAEAEAALKREIEQIGADRRKLNQDLIDTATRLRGVESKIAATQERLRPLDDNEQRYSQIARWPPRRDRRDPGRIAADRTPAARGADLAPGRCAAVNTDGNGAWRSVARDAA